MLDNGTRIQAVALLIAMTFPLLGAGMAWAEITGRCRWLIAAGRVVIGATSALLTASSLVLIGALAVVAVRTLVLGK